MNAPNKIRVHGQVYIKVEAAGHKKCEPGTHWNEKHHKCMKIPHDLKHFVDKAHNLSARAHATAKKVPKKLTNKAPLVQARTDHHMAADAHGNAFWNAKKRGFNALAKEHQKHAKAHSKAAHDHTKLIKRYEIDKRKALRAQGKKVPVRKPVRKPLSPFRSFDD